jgi:hypothetical protein
MQTTTNKTAAELTAEIQKLINSGETFAHVCSVTGRGMWEGHYFEDNGKYAYDQQAAEVIAEELGYRDYLEAYEEGAAYWTEWHEDEPQFVEIAGKMYSLDDLESIAQIIYKNVNQ